MNYIALPIDYAANTMARDVLMWNEEGVGYAFVSDVDIRRLDLSFFNAADPQEVIKM